MYISPSHLAITVELALLVPVLPCNCLLLNAGSLLTALCARMLEFSTHDKGVYVLQAAAGIASTAELVEMAQVCGMTLCNRSRTINSQ